MSETMHLYRQGDRPERGGPLCQQTYGGMTIREMIQAKATNVESEVDCESCLRAMAEEETKVGQS